jgi:hypothetical protein
MLLHSTRVWLVGLGQTRHHVVESRRSTTWKSKYPDLTQNMRLKALSPPPPASRPKMPPALSRLVSRSHSMATVSIATFRSVPKSWEVGSREVLYRREGYRLNRAGKRNALFGCQHVQLGPGRLVEQPCSFADAVTQVVSRECCCQVRRRSRLNFTPSVETPCRKVRSGQPICNQRRRRRRRVLGRPSLPRACGNGRPEAVVVLVVSEDSCEPLRRRGRWSR